MMNRATQSTTSSKGTRATLLYYSNEAAVCIPHAPPARFHCVHALAHSRRFSDLVATLRGTGAHAGARAARANCFGSTSSQHHSSAGPSPGAHAARFQLSGTGFAG